MRLHPEGDAAPAAAERERPVRAERPARAERPSRDDRPARGEKPFKGDKPVRGDKLLKVKRSAASAEEKPRSARSGKPAAPVGKKPKKFVKSKGADSSRKKKD
jgi:hypothetical protein